MTTAVTSSASSDILQQLLRLGAANQASTAGQLSPGDALQGAAVPAGLPPAALPAKASSAADSFSPDTLSALVSSQAQTDAATPPALEAAPGVGGSTGLQQAHHGHGHHHHGGGAPPADTDDTTAAASDIASSIIGAADSSGTGALSLDDFAKALSSGSSGAGPASTDVSQAFASIDSDGDGKIGQGELTSAIQSFLSTQAQAGGYAAEPASGAAVSLAA